MWNYFLYMESRGAAGAAMGVYFVQMSPVTVFLVLALLPFAEKNNIEDRQLTGGRHVVI
jgi:hypothetical protein